MDPNVTLEEIRRLWSEFYADHRDGGARAGEIGAEMGERWIDLDTWLTGGGFLPASWQR